ncbi:unnamed protein product [Eruca vesicaria subsp. sativa]|uniref:OTU domain-containing protein n=1 Tax=Eruca vesicaria subsp. sativa TaxID=29727 RepID=A0ABC8M184_ERUVS|nr:unnamed protein product [Eruca vesicaria subsp. sativa]
MGKLLCDSTATIQSPSPTVSWREPSGDVDLVNQSSAFAAIEAAEKTISATTTAWDDVSGLEEQQRRHLQRLHLKGVLWKHPGKQDSSVVFRLSHGGEVSSDGNCLFTASQKAMEARGVDARELRLRTVRRFLEDYGTLGEEEKEAVKEAVRHMYSPDLKRGWGIHIVQEEKFLAKKVERESLDNAIDELMQIGMQRFVLFFFFSEQNLVVSVFGS